MITVQQIKAARALLDWNQSDLGQSAGLSQTAVANIENGKFRASEASLQAFLAAFDAAGVEFIPGGVRKKINIIETIEGDDFGSKIMDYVYETLLRTGNKEVLISGVDYHGLDEAISNDILAHIQRLQAAGMNERVLVKPGTLKSEIIGPSDWHRTLDSTLFSAEAPFFVFADCYAIDLIGKKQVIIIRNQQLADDQRNRFNFMWDKASEELKD